MAIAHRPDAAEATRRLFDEYARTVLAICRVTLRDADEAEDAAQQTFLAVHRSLLGGTVPRNPSAWVATIARNECRARLRRNGSTSLPLDAEAVAGSHETDANDAVSESLAELPERQREAVVLRDVFGLSHPEIATALGVNVGAVNSLLTRARGRLRRRLRGASRGAPSVLVPPALRDQLAQLIPGFEASAGTAGGAGAFGLAAKLASAPAAAKVAAVLGVATVGATAPQLARQRAEQPRAVAAMAAKPSRGATRPALVTRAGPSGGGRGDDARRGARSHRGSSRRRDSGGPRQEESAKPSNASTPEPNSGSGKAQTAAVTETDGSSGPGPSPTEATASRSSNRGPGGGGDVAATTTTTTTTTPTALETHSGPGGGGGETRGATDGSGSGKDGTGG